jgi:hypothetical protein
MTEDEFAALPLEGKWNHLKKTMDYIVNMDKQYDSKNNTFSLRRRYNPHHPEEQAVQETASHKEQQRSLRVDQFQRWAHVKALYSVNRDELANTLDNNDFAGCRNILERIFTLEVDEALRSLIGE